MSQVSDRLEESETSRRHGAENLPKASHQYPASGLAVSVIFIASVALYWHGFGPMGDAERYVAAALRWREEGPFLGETHWALRHLFVLPMAAAFEVFGPSEFAATLPNILYAAGLVAITYFFVRRYLGRTEGTAAAVLIAISAFFVARPMEIGVYGAEAFFGASSCWLFIAAQLERRRIALLIAAGAVAGFAWTVREQTIYLITAFGLLTLLGRKQTLLSLIALAAGFGAVLTVELLIYWAAAGDPFYRYRVDLHHRTVGWKVLDVAKDTALEKFLRPIHDLVTDPITTPLLFASIIAMIAMMRRGVMDSAGRRQAFVSFAVISAVAAIISAYGFDLATPRYYPVLPYFVVLILGVAVVAIGRRYSRWASAGSVAMIAVLNAAGEDFGSYNEYAEARLLVGYAKASDEPIYTDPLTASRARYLLRLSEVSRERIAEIVRSDRTYPSGVLFYKASPTEGRSASWCALERKDVRPLNWTHAIIRSFGLDKALGNSVERIVARPQPVELVRVLREDAAIDPYSGKPCLNAPAKRTGAAIAAPVMLFF